MTASIFKAIGRGYSARNILQSISRKAPKYANTINTAYYAGYAAQDILSRIASQKDGKNYSPDQFMTEHEKTLRNHERNKKYATMEAIGMAGTAGAVGVGIAQLYSYLQKQKALHPDEIIIPDKRYLRGKQKSPHTIHQSRPQIGHDKKRITYEAGEQKNSLPYSPALLEGPKSSNQNNSVEPTQGPPPFKNVPPAVFNKNFQGQNDPIPPPQPENTVKPYMKSLNVLEGLGEANRIMNMIEGGMTNDEMKLVLPVVMPKEAYKIVSKGKELDKILNDMQEYIKENPRTAPDLKNGGNYDEFVQNRRAQEQERQYPPQMPASQQKMQQQMPAPQQQMQQQIQPEQNEQIPSIMNLQMNEPINISPEITRPIASIEPEISSRMVQTKSGESGDLIDVKNGVATLDVNGQEKKFKFSDIETAPQNVEEAIRTVLNSIPEGLKSTALMGTIHIPFADLMLTTFYDGKMAWYKNVSVDRYNKIVFSAKTPKGQARTGIAEYSPDSADSRGSEFHDFKTDPLYSKANEGKTWGYIDNKYNVFDNVQSIIHKISKERYDADGNLITSKPRVKKEPVKPTKSLSSKEVKQPPDSYKSSEKKNTSLSKQDENKIKKFEEKLKEAKLYGKNKLSEVEYYENEILKIRPQHISGNDPITSLGKGAIRDIFTTRNNVIHEVLENENEKGPLSSLTLNELIKSIKEFPNAKKSEIDSAIEHILETLKFRKYIFKE